jgi:hypothetical protein
MRSLSQLPVKPRTPESLAQSLTQVRPATRLKSLEHNLLRVIHDSLGEHGDVHVRILKLPTEVQIGVQRAKAARLGPPPLAWQPGRSCLNR